MPRPDRIPKNTRNDIINGHRGNASSDQRIKDRIVELEEYEAGITTEDALIAAIENDIVNYTNTKREEMRDLIESRNHKKNGKSYVEDKILDVHYE